MGENFVFFLLSNFELCRKKQRNKQINENCLVLPTKEYNTPQKNVYFENFYPEKY